MAATSTDNNIIKSKLDPTDEIMQKMLKEAEESQKKFNQSQQDDVIFSISLKLSKKANN